MKKNTKIDKEIAELVEEIRVAANKIKVEAAEIEKISDRIIELREKLKNC